MNDTNNATIPIREDDIYRFRIGKMLNADSLIQPINQNEQNKPVLLAEYRKLIDDLLAALIKENLLTIHAFNVGENVKLEVRLDILKDSKIRGITGATLGHTIQALKDKIDNT